MDCRTAEGMVSSYIEHKLPVIELVHIWSEHLSPDRSSGGGSGLCNDGNGAYFIRYWRIL